MSELRRAIEAELAKFWDERSLELDDDPDTTDQFVDRLDSMTAVDALIGVEKLVGIEIKESAVVRRGGYDSKEQFLSDLPDRIVKYVERHQK
jgi:acyl carrier protein